MDIEAPCPELENSANKICWLQWCRCIQNMSFTICSYKSYFRFYKILRCLASILLTFAFCLIWIFSCDQQLKEWPCHSVSSCPFSDLVISSMWTCGDLSCRFCSTGSPENQEHLEICGGTEYERRGLDMSRWRGILTFWRRMTMKLMEAPVKKKKTDVTHQQNQWQWWLLIAAVAFKPINLVPCVILINVHGAFC